MTVVILDSHIDLFNFFYFSLYFIHLGPIYLLLVVLSTFVLHLLSFYQVYIINSALLITHIIILIIIS